MYEYLNDLYRKIKSWYNDNTLNNIISIVNFVPNLFGFSLKEARKKPYFFLLHFCLLLYVYGAGVTLYLLREARTVAERVVCYENISLQVFIVANSFWFLGNSNAIKKILEMAKVNDEMVATSPNIKQEHVKVISYIKKIVLVFYLINLFNAIFIYLPKRSDLSGTYCMVLCAGMDLTRGPQRIICRLILIAQELSIMIVVLNFQTLIILLISHATAMYHMLAKEITELDALNPEDGTISEYCNIVNRCLVNMIVRHCLLLKMLERLKSLYSLPVGINFGSHIVCIMLIFFLPIVDEYVKFIPIFCYCVLVFLLYSFLCQKLIDAAEMFESATYGCGWENFDLRGRKNIYIMYMLSQKTVEILAAGIVPVNMATFATTCQAMYKFVTVVKL